MLLVCCLLWLLVPRRGRVDYERDSPAVSWPINVVDHIPRLPTSLRFYVENHLLSPARQSTTSPLRDLRQQGMAPPSVTDTCKDRTQDGSRRSPPPHLRRHSSRYLALINGVATLCTFSRKEVVDSDSDLEVEQGGVAAIAPPGGKRSVTPASKSSGRGMDRGDRSLMSWRLGRSKKSPGQVWECSSVTVFFCTYPIYVHTGSLYRGGWVARRQNPHQLGPALLLIEMCPRMIETRVLGGYSPDGQKP